MGGSGWGMGGWRPVVSSISHSTSSQRYSEQEGRVVYDYIVKQKGDALDKGTDGLTIIKGGKIIFDGTEKTAPTK